MDPFTEILTPDKKPSSLSWIIFGKPKTGKTTLACQWPDPLLVDIEGGTAFVAVPQFPLKRLVSEGGNCLVILRSLYTSLQKNPGKFKTVIFDTADELFKMIASPYKKDGIIPLKAYQQIYEGFTGIIESFKALGIDVVLTAHEKQIIDEDSGAITETTVALSGKLAADTGGRVDEIIYLTIKQVPIEGTDPNEKQMRQARYAVCQPTAHARLGLIMAGDRSGVLPAHIVDPTYEKLSIAKGSTPRGLGLFDGLGDLVPETTDDEAANAVEQDLFSDGKE